MVTAAPVYEYNTTDVSLLTRRKLLKVVLGT